MCMGVTHRAINTVVSLPVTGALLIEAHWSPLEAVIFWCGYTFATFLVNPDLDLDSIGYKSWGILRFYWWPYQRALAHRCFLSHFPVVGTICRIIYLFWLPILVIFLLGSATRAKVSNDVFEYWPVYGAFLLLWVLGMIISDTIHAVLDVASTDFKHATHNFLSGGHHHHPHHGFFAHHNQEPPRYRSERGHNHSHSSNYRRRR